MTGGLFAILCAAAIVGSYKLGQAAGQLDRFYELWSLREELEEIAQENEELRTLMRLDEELEAEQ